MNVVFQYKERFRKEFLVKFDMHCHTKEGSLDGKVEIEEYIRILKEKVIRECWYLTIILIMVTDTGEITSKEKSIRTS